jgi:glycosyltransferase involved in cell wall biosynthesis
LGGSGDNRLLRVLHIDPERNWGGGEAQVFGLLRHLAARGHRNDLFAHPHGLLFQRGTGLKITTHPMVMRNDLDLRCVAALRRAIREVGYDIVHFHTKRAHSLALWLQRGGTRPRYVVTRRMDYPEARSWYTHFLYNRRVDGVVAISQAIRDVLIRSGVEKEKIRVICSGIDPAAFARVKTAIARPAGATMVGCLAGLEERKGHRYLFEAAAMLKAEGLNIQYKIGGAGPLRAQLEEESVRLGLAGHVHFLGFVSDTAEFFAGIDVLAMPSLYEGLGVAVLEAMAAGKPVIATRVGGLVESVVDDVTGILVPPRDPAALAAAIAKFARSHTLGLSMGQQGRERVRQEYSLEKMALQNESYYRALLGDSANLH